MNLTCGGLAAPRSASDDHHRGCSRAPSAAKRRQFDSPSTNASTSDACTQDVQRSDARSARPSTARRQAHGLFVAGSPERQFRRMAHVFVHLTVRQGDGGELTDGPQDKSAAFGRAHVVGWVELILPSRSTPPMVLPTETPRFSTSSAPSPLRRSGKQTRRRHRRSVANSPAAGAPTASQRVRLLRYCGLTWHVAEPTRLSSRPEDFHLRALPEPYMNLSIHTAPDVRPVP